MIFLSVPSFCHLSARWRAAVEAVGGGPILYCFFAVGPEQPHAVAFALLAAKLVGQFEQDGGGGAAVVGADVAGIAQRIVGVVVAGDDDHAVARAGKFGDDISHRKFAFGSVGGEGVVFHVIVLQVGEDVVFELLVIRAADGARAEGDHLAGVLHGAGGVEGLGGRWLARISKTAELSSAGVAPAV